jgi:hypothetical protein
MGARRREGGAGVRDGTGMGGTGVGAVAVVTTAAGWAGANECPHCEQRIRCPVSSGLFVLRRLLQNGQTTLVTVMAKGPVAGDTVTVVRWRCRPQERRNETEVRFAHRYPPSTWR